MKYVFSILVFFICTTLNAQWRKLYSNTDTNSFTFGASFYTQSSGFFANTKWVGFTTDTGRTILQRPINMSNIDLNGFSLSGIPVFTPRDVKAFNKDTLIVTARFGLNPIIVKSTNGGITWKVVYYENVFIDFENYFSTISFPDNGNIGFVCTGFKILKTNNRGETWQTVYTQGTDDLQDIIFLNTSLGFGVTPNKIVKTINGGVNWATYSNFSFEISSFDAIGEQRLFVNTLDGDNLYSENGGQTWTIANTLVGQARGYIDYINDSTGYLTNTGTVYQTRNRGKSWEIMETTPSNIATYSMQFYFYDLQQMWAFGGISNIWHTSNGGGISLPSALFEAVTSSVCTNNTIQLVNQSHNGYSYKWYRNNELLATSYNTSYSIISGVDTIKLVVEKQGIKDSLIRIITANPNTSISLNSIPKNDSSCNTISVDIPNSKTNVFYQLGRGGVFNSPIQGTGSIITLTFSVPFEEESTSTFTVRAYRSNECGPQTDSQRHVITVLPTAIPVTAIPDTICTQNVFYVKVINSRSDYFYWIDNTLPKVSGNGGIIELPHRALNDNYGGEAYKTYPIAIRAAHKTLGCGGEGWDQTGVDMTGRRGYAKFDIYGFDWFIKDTLVLRNQSTQLSSSLWKFSTGSNVSTSSLNNPSNIIFNTEGYKEVKMISYTSEGCSDSAYRIIEVFKKEANTPQGSICTSSLPGNSVDSLLGTQYFVSRSIIEDKYGNRTIAGGYTDLIFAPGPRGVEEIFVAKFNKTGQKLWFLRSEFSAENGSSYTIAEQAFTDSLGYTYVLGRSYNSTQFKIYQTDITYQLPKACVFILKISPSGRLIWLKDFHYADAPLFPLATFVKGGNNDFYLITYLEKGYPLYSGNELIFDNSQQESGIMLHMSLDGKIIRKRTFPAFYSPVNPNYSNNGNYTDVAQPLYTKNKLLTFYSELNSAEIQGNTVDDIQIPYNTDSIKSSLYVFDTASFKFKAFKPIFKESTDGIKTGVNSETFTVDSLGNYYVSFRSFQDIEPSSGDYSFDTLKPKDFIYSYDSTGKIRWAKVAEGLHPSNMISTNGNKLKIGGRNYSQYFHGSIFYGNQSPTYDSVRKTTILYNQNSFTGLGSKGIGSLDLVMATVNSNTGELTDLLHFGSPQEDESMVFSKGHGDQLWVAGTVGSNWLDVDVNTPSDSVSKVYTYKLPVNNSCITNFDSEPSFVKIDIPPTSVQCIDSLFKIKWSSRGVNKVRLLYKLTGSNNYALLKDSLDASLESFQFNAAQRNILGLINFKIEAINQPYTDTNSISIYKKVSPAVTITASTTTFCYGTNVTFTATPVNGGSNPGYRWIINNVVYSTSGNTYTTNQLQNQSVIYAELLRNDTEPCLLTTYAKSNEIIVTVTPGTLVPAISISGNAVVNTGQQTIINSSIVNGGTSPKYQWQDSTGPLLWQTIQGAINPSINYTPQKTGDKLRCILTSNQSCVTQFNAVSTPITFTVNVPTAAPSLIISGQSVRIFPNPASNTVFIDSLLLADRWQSLEIISIDGKRSLVQYSLVNQTKISIDISNLPSGLYIIKLTKKNGSEYYFKLLKQ
jgi:hypothetical protein